MLDSIAWAEGGVTYRTMFGGGQFDTSKGWKHPDKVINAGGYSSAAAGRYQFMPSTWFMAAKALGLKDFSPINQDKAAIWLMDRRLRGDSAEILRKEGLSNRVLNAFSGEWAAVPNAMGGSTLNQPHKKLQDFKDKYNTLLKSTPSPPPAPPTPGPNVPFTVPQLDPNLRYQKGGVLTGTIGRGVPYVEIGDVLGAPRAHGPHQGIDIFAPVGTYIALRLGGKVLYAGWQDPNNHDSGYGLMVDMWVPELGVQLRFGHCSELLCSTGTNVKPGESFARVGYSGNANPKSNEGAHIHFESTKEYNKTTYGSSSDPSPYIPFLILSGYRLSAKDTKGRQSNQRNIAQISSTGTGLNTVDNITPSNEGETLYITVPPQAYQSSKMMGGYGGSGGNVTIYDENGLNKLIKQRILLELSYT